MTPGLLISKSGVGGFAPICSVKFSTDDSEERSSFPASVLQCSPIGLAAARSSRARGTPDHGHAALDGDAPAASPMPVWAPMATTIRPVIGDVRLGPFGVCP